MTLMTPGVIQWLLLRPFHKTSSKIVLKGGLRVAPMLLNTMSPTSVRQNSSDVFAKGGKTALYLVVELCMLRSKIENAHWAEKRPQCIVALEKRLQQEIACCKTFRVVFFVSELQVFTIPFPQLTTLPRKHPQCISHTYNSVAEDCFARRHIGALFMELSAAAISLRAHSRSSWPSIVPDRWSPEEMTSTTIARTFLGARRPRSRSDTLITTFVPVSTAGILELEKETIFWASCSWLDFTPSRWMLIRFFLTQRLQVTFSPKLCVHCNFLK